MTTQKRFFYGYQNRTFDDHFSPMSPTDVDIASLYPYSHTDTHELSDFIYPGASYAYDVFLRYCQVHAFEGRCTPECPTPRRGPLKIHPLLYIPEIRFFDFTSSWRSILILLEKWVHGTWWLYLEFFPIPHELKKKIYYILAYLMFFHPVFKFKYINYEGALQKNLLPLYQLTQGFQEKK